MAVMREKLIHLFNIGTSASPEWILLGDGITSLTEEFNPESETKQYINNANGTTAIKSYTPSISVEREYISDTLQTWIDEKIKTLPTGSNAESEYIRINLLDETTTAGTYNAVKRKCSYQFDSIGGDAGSELKNSMTLGGIGDAKQGTVVVSTTGGVTTYTWADAAS